MNKSHRPSLKLNLDFPHSSHSPIRKNKNNDDSNRKTTAKKVKEIPIQARPKQEKIRSVSKYGKKQKVRQSENRIKREGSKIGQLSPSKVNKTAKKVSNNKQNKNESREIQRQKMLDEYLKSKFIMNQKGKEICNQSTQFFLPLTHTLEKQNSVNLISQLISSDESYMQQDVPSQFSAPISYQKLHQDSSLKQSRIISLQQWQKYETLKLKNEQLANYIEELQKIQKKLVEDKAKQQILLKQQSNRDREQLMQDYSQLNEKHMKVSYDNSVLQQMFNEGRSAIQALRYQNVSLTQRASVREEQAQHLKNSNLRLKNDSIQLTKEVFALKEALVTLHNEKQQVQKKYENVCLQKETIKASAEEMLGIIKKMQITHEN